MDGVRLNIFRLSPRAHACVGLCCRCRGDREEHERGADGGRRREAALRGLLLPRVGAARLRCGPAGLTGRPRQRSACMCIHGRPAGAAGDGDTTARTRRKSPETLKEMSKLKDTSFFSSCSFLNFVGVVRRRRLVLTVHQRRSFVLPASCWAVWLSSLGILMWWPETV